MDAWTLLTQFKFIDAAIAVYTNLIGGWFYALGLFMILLMIYLKSQSIVPTAIVGILSGFLMNRFVTIFPADAQMIGILFIVICVAAILHDVWFKE